MTTKIVLSTSPSIEIAEEMAAKLVSERLAACVNIVPGMTSIYYWQGKVERAQECQLIIKTSDQKVAGLEIRLHELHPYEVPEFVVLEPGYVSEKYQGWIFEVLA